MQIGERIEYRTGWADSGIGIVVAYNEETETVVVKDEDDGSIWRGPADLTTSLDNH